jgi:hypothetical protein
MRRRLCLRLGAWSPLLLVTLVTSAAAETAVAVAPLGELGLEQGEARQVGRWLEQAIAAVPGCRLVERGRLERQLARRGDPECVDTPECLAGAARRAGAEQIVAGDVGRLGDGFILYLRLLDRSGRRLRSLSEVLDAAEHEEMARRIAYQLLLPARYSGKLALQVDVAGAWVYINGRRLGRSPTPALELPVGTHALRVTHEDYRDFVRFVRVAFEQQETVKVDLKALPIDKRRMNLVPEGPRVLADNELPWYRRWWAVLGFGVAVAATTTVIVALLPKSVDADREVVVHRQGLRR